MRIPAPFELNEFNRIVGAVDELCLEESGCEISSIINLCSSVTFGGRPSNHRKIIRLTQFAGLISLDELAYIITELGKEFLQYNQRFSYEITDTQKAFIAERLILNGPWQSRARGFFQGFDPNHSKVTFEFDTLNKELPIRHASIQHLLKHLNVIREDEGVLYVEPQYVAIIVEIRADVEKTSLHDLEAALEANRRIGDIAEDAVVQYEKERLQNIGRNLEATLVRKISILDISAGYDIESFDGDKPSFAYDRFIEVKGSQNDEMRFYWTANERNVAERLGEKYWIYFVPSVKPDRKDDIKPIIINDPFHRLDEIEGLSIEPSTYLISQICREEGNRRVDNDIDVLPD